MYPQVVDVPVLEDKCRVPSGKIVILPESLCDTLKLEMRDEFFQLLGLPDIVSNKILNKLLEEAVKMNNARMVSFEESPIKNGVTRMILIDVFNYLVRSWTNIVWVVESASCYCSYPYARALREIQVPDKTMEDWRNYFGLPQELEWYNLFDRDDSDTLDVKDDGEE